jgi:RecB family exonuclease
MRREAGLLLPDRRIGLSAHDFQMAMAAPEIVLTRALRDAEAETVPSRWLNRLTNLVDGLPDQGGPHALQQMRAKGHDLLARAAALEAPTADVPAARRPSPRPPVAARPTRLRVTEVERLIRDPFAVYARSVLNLSPLDPLRADPDALSRGIALHTIMEKFAEATAGALPPDAADRLHDIAEAVLRDEVPWPVAQRHWLATLDNRTTQFLADESDRRARATPWQHEVAGKAEVATTGVTLSGRADRIDRFADGTLALYDYKTGSIPSEDQRKTFSFQLPLMAKMLALGAFDDVPASQTRLAAYIGLGAKDGEHPVDLADPAPDEVWTRLARLLARFAQRDQGYTARRMAESDALRSDYDHLARLGEWDVTDLPDPTEVGDG